MGDALTGYYVSRWRRVSSKRSMSAAASPLSRLVSAPGLGEPAPASSACRFFRPGELKANLIASRYGCSCRVTIQDAEGISQTVEVTAVLHTKLSHRDWRRSAATNGLRMSANASAW